MILKICYSTVILFLLSACATILNPKYQKVTINTGDKTAYVLLDSAIIGHGESFVAPLKRDFNVKELTISSEVYENYHVAAMPVYKSWMYVFSLVPFGALMAIPICYDNFPKAYNYPRTYNFHQYQQNQEGIRKFFKDSLSNHLKINKVSFIGGASDIWERMVIHRKYFWKKGNLEDFSSKAFPVNSETSYLNQTAFWAKELDGILDSKGYTNNKTNFANDDYKINLGIANIQINKIFYQSYFGYAGDYFYRVDAHLKWTVENNLGEIIYSKEQEIFSGEFTGGAYDFEDKMYYKYHGIKKSCSNLIFKGFGYLHQDSLFRAAIKIEKSEDDLTTYSLSQTNLVNTIEEAVAATVTVETNRGHGSGFFIGDKGEIITNYHVIAGAEKINVILNDGSERKATVLRSNLKHDLCLLKIDSGSFKVFDLKQTDNGDIGDEIFVIGTPSSIELSQTITQGIISGERMMNNSKLFQTDASINSGNSGGPMISKEGKLIGVISSKIVGNGIEGLGFCIPSKSIVSQLNINLE